ncbi:MAG: ribonuclease P protein component [Myxococcales bacterium]|nr:ribonuclease P protein component [Myxococcales bacterium]
MSPSAQSPNLHTATTDCDHKIDQSTQSEQSFPKSSRLRKRGQFLRAQRVGRRIYTAHLIVYVSKNRDQNNRLGLTVSKKVGKAHYRNKVKRCIREAFRHSNLRQGQGFDISVIAKREAPEFKRSQLMNEFNHLAQQIENLSFSRASKNKSTKVKIKKTKLNRSDPC